MSASWYHSLPRNTPRHPDLRDVRKANLFKAMCYWGCSISSCLDDAKCGVVFDLFSRTPLHVQSRLITIAVIQSTLVDDTVKMESLDWGQA